MPSERRRILELALESLEHKKSQIDAEIAGLTGELRRGGAARGTTRFQKVVPKKAARKRSRFSKEERERRAVRMKEYWKKWREERAHSK